MGCALRRLRIHHLDDVAFIQPEMLNAKNRDFLPGADG
jgi:hypothetical protein